MIRNLDGARIAHIRQPTLRVGLDRRANGLHPLIHVIPRQRLEEVMPSVLRIDLECERPLVVDKRRNTRIDEAEHNRGLVRGREV